jgi:hypothetical protein
LRLQLQLRSCAKRRADYAFPARAPERSHFLNLLCTPTKHHPSRQKPCNCDMSCYSPISVHPLFWARISGPEGLLASLQPSTRIRTPAGKVTQRRADPEHIQSFKNLRSYLRPLVWHACLSKTVKRCRPFPDLGGLLFPLDTTRATVLKNTVITYGCVAGQGLGGYLVR